MAKAFTVDYDDNQRVLQVTGCLDEHTGDRLQLAAGRITAGTAIRVECGGIESINSIGVGAWLRFMEGLPVGVAFELHKCPGPFLTYCQLIDRFLRRGPIASVLLRWECLDCGYKEPVVLSAKEAAAVKVLEACPRCKKKDIAPDCDLDFLKTLAT